MRRGARSWPRVGACALLLGGAIACGAVGGCDAGGLLVVQGSSTGGPDAGPVVLGPTNDLVNAGNVAKNGKYKIVYTLGQPTQSQNVEKSDKDRLNGGLVGAMNGR